MPSTPISRTRAAGAFSASSLARIIRARPSRLAIFCASATTVFSASPCSASSVGRHQRIEHGRDVGRRADGPKPAIRLQADGRRRRGHRGRDDALRREDPPVADREQQFAGDRIGRLLRERGHDLVVDGAALERSERGTSGGLLGALRAGSPLRQERDLGCAARLPDCLDRGEPDGVGRRAGRASTSAATTRSPGYVASAAISTTCSPSASFGSSGADLADGLGSERDGHVWTAPPRAPARPGPPACRARLA